MPHKLKGKTYQSKTKEPKVRYESDRAKQDKGLKDYGKSRIPKEVPPMAEIFEKKKKK